MKRQHFKLGLTAEKRKKRKESEKDYSPITRGFSVNTSHLLWMWRQALPNWIVGPSCRVHCLWQKLKNVQLFKQNRRRQPNRSLYANILVQTLANHVRATPENSSMSKWRKSLLSRPVITRCFMINLYIGFKLSLSSSQMQNKEFIEVIRFQTRNND